MIDTNSTLYSMRLPIVNKIVKVIVRQKSNPKEFEKFIDKLYSLWVYKILKIIENFDISRESEDL